MTKDAAGTANEANEVNDFDARASTWDDNPTKIACARAVADAISAQLPDAALANALEYGCGTGLLGFALYPRLGRATLADSSPGMLAVLGQKIAAQRIDNMQPLRLDLSVDPLPAQRFSTVFSQLTLHHVDDVERLLRAFHALLETPGYLCVADLDREDGSFHGEGFSGHCGFDRGALQRQAERVGFGNVRFSTAYCIEKPDSPGQTHFPVFLMVAQKR